MSIFLSIFKKLSDPKKEHLIGILFFYYYLAFFGIAVVCLVLDAQYKPAPNPMPVIIDSANAADPDNTIPISGKNIFNLLLAFN
jgi:uncharacterized membrane protein